MKTPKNKPKVTSKRLVSRELVRAPSRRCASDPRNSSCGSARLCDLDWSNWWTDSYSGAGIYLHVRRLDPDLDGLHESDATWHRVHCRLAAHPRLSIVNGRIYWLIDRPNKTGDQFRGQSAP